MFLLFFFFSSRRRHTRSFHVTGVQTCALPIAAWQSRRTLGSPASPIGSIDTPNGDMEPGVDLLARRPSVPTVACQAVRLRRRGRARLDERPHRDRLRHRSDRRRAGRALAATAVRARALPRCAAHLRPLHVSAMTDGDWLAQRFEEHRPHLRAVAYRMLGSLSEAEDAVQEAWIRLSRTDTSEVENLRAWLTTVVSRVCLNLLRSRRVRREAPLEVHLPDPIVSGEDGVDPEQQALIGDSVGLAMLVVLETLSPAERVAFVLHDVFGVPFDEIAPIVGRSSTATRQLASRARRRVRGAPVTDADLPAQRAVVDAFLTAAQQGDFDALIAVLDPDVVLRSDA